MFKIGWKCNFEKRQSVRFVKQCFDDLMKEDFLSSFSQKYVTSPALSVV